MQEKLQWMEARYEELGMLLSEPATLADTELFGKYMREHAQLEPIVAAWRAHQALLRQAQEAEEMLLDPELCEEAEAEGVRLQAEILQSTQKVQHLLLPKDPNDNRNVVMEIRAGAGGEEACLFGAVLLRMYMRYAERHGWRTEMVDANMTELGGVKEVTFTLTGSGAFRRLKFESGVHRVQRVPTTESGGRVHTSTATVAVLPEAEDVEIDIRPGDVRVDVYRSSGHGGQCVNTTDSAVRITHLPTGLVVTCQDEKSQIKNRDKAMRVMRSRLYDLIQTQKDSEYAQRRRDQVGTGDRSERIRTYNFPQGRVTDHRIGLTIYQIDAFVDGDCDEILDALQLDDESHRLAELAKEESSGMKKNP